MRRIILATCIAATALALTSCAKVEAKTPGPTPVSLKVPEPPLRLNIPVPAEPPPPPPVATEKPAPPTSPASRPRPTPTPTPPPASQETTPPVIQTGGQDESRAKDRLAVAVQNIDKVKRESLSREAQDQYDSAQRFIRMTRDALATRNFVYAAYCADKAATLAVLLVK